MSFRNVPYTIKCGHGVIKCQHTSSTPQIDTSAPSGTMIGEYSVIKFIWVRRSKRSVCARIISSLGERSHTGLCVRKGIPGPRYLNAPFTAECRRRAESSERRGRPNSANPPTQSNLFIVRMVYSWDPRNTVGIFHANLLAPVELLALPIAPADLRSFVFRYASPSNYVNQFPPHYTSKGRL